MKKLLGSLFIAGLPVFSAFSTSPQLFVPHAHAGVADEAYKEGKDVVKIGKAVDTPRSTNTELANNTGKLLVLVREQTGCEHGKFSTRPPSEIPPGEVGRWSSKDKGFMTGVECVATYRVPEEDVFLTAKYINAFVGNNKTRYSIEGKNSLMYGVHHSAGAGNTGALMQFEIFEDDRRPECREQPVLFEHRNQTGRGLSLGEGSIENLNIPEIGFDNSTTALCVPEGWALRVFAHPKFKGKHLDFIGPTVIGNLKNFKHLKRWDDGITSVEAKRSQG